MKSLLKTVCFKMIILICIDISTDAFILYSQTNQQLTQTNGPIGGRFKKVLAFNKGWNEIDAGWDHSVAINFDGSLWAWGKNNAGQVGNKTIIDQSKPILIDSSKNWRLVKAGGNHCIAFRAPLNYDDTNKSVGIYVWGFSGYGQLALGYPFVDKNSPTELKYFEFLKYLLQKDFDNVRISAGANYCLVIAEGKLYAWGRNDNGQIGNNGTPIQSYVVEIGGTNWKEIASGDDHNLAIKTDGTLWAWGRNEFGQLGDSTKTNRNIPIQVGTDNDWKLISCGSNHSIAVKNDGTIWGWGQNTYYQLGDNTTNQTQLIPKKLNSDTWRYIECGNFFTVAQKSNGNFYSWGANHKGQLGDGTTYYRNVPTFIKNNNYHKVVGGGNYTLALHENGDIYSWGDGQYGKTGIGTSNDSIPKMTKNGTNVLFAIQNGFDNTVLKSVDEGENWQRVAIQLNGSSFFYPSDIKQQFSSLLLNGSNGLIESADMGNHWNFVSPIFGYSGFNNIDIYKNHILLSGSSIWFSSNNGNSYANSNSSRDSKSATMLFDDYSGIRLIDGKRTIAFSSDTGKTWQKEKTIYHGLPTWDSDDPEFNVIYPSKDRKSFYAGSENGKLYSGVYDGNVTLLGGVKSNSYLTSYYPTRVINTLISKDSILLIGTNENIQIVSQPAGYDQKSNYVYAKFNIISDTNYLIDIKNFSANTANIYAATDGFGILWNDNPGTPWKQFTMKNQHILSMASMGNTVYSLTNKGGIYKSDDKGSTWSNISIGLPDYNANYSFVPRMSATNTQLFFINPYQIYNYNQNKWNLYQDTSFKKLTGYTDLIIDAQFDSKYDYLFIGTYSLNTLSTGKLLRKETLSGKFDEYSLPSGYFIKTLLINNKLYICTTKGIYSTNTNSIKWDSLYNSKVSIGLFDADENRLVMCVNTSSMMSDSNIFVSSDNGKTWILFNKGQFPKYSYLTTIKIVGSALYAVINNQIWYTPISTPHWRILTDSANVDISCLYEMKGTLFAGTQFNSVWKVQLSPILISPEDSANQVPTLPNFTWLSVNGAKNYEIQISDKSDYSSILFTKISKDTFYIPSTTLLESTRYFWRVRVQNSEDIWSSWSNNNVFATRFPSMTIKLSPSSNPENKSMVQPFLLADPNKKKGWVYQIQFALDKDFSNIKVNQFKDSIFFYSELQKGTNYYYRIRQFDTLIGFGGEWLPKSNINTITTATDQISFTPTRDGFNFTNSGKYMWRPEHYKIFNTGSHFPSYSDFEAAFGWVSKSYECCCRRKYILFGPRICQNIFSYNTITRWQGFGNGIWSGSCYGFSILSLQNYAADKKPYNISLPLNDNLQRLINQRHVYQVSRTAVSNTVFVSPNSLAGYLRSVFASNNKYSYPEMAFFWNGNGHSVVPYMVTSGVSSGRSVDSIWIYSNWSSFDVDNPKLINDFIIIDRATNTWKWETMSYGTKYVTEVSGGYQNFELIPVSVFNNRPELRFKPDDQENTQTITKRGEFLLAQTDSLYSTSFWVSNNKNVTIKDQSGRTLVLDSIAESKIPNAYQLKSYGGLKDSSKLILFGSLIIPSDSGSKYSIEKIPTNSSDTNSIKVFALGYSSNISWLQKITDKPLVVTVSDSTHGILINSKSIAENVGIEVYKDDGNNYQKSIKIRNTQLSQDEDFLAGFSPDSKEFRITNDGKDKKYDITVDLGIEVNLPSIKFENKDTHIYRLVEPKTDEDTTKLTLTIDRSARGKKDTTIIYTGKIDTLTNVAEWYNNKSIANLKVEIKPLPITTDVFLTLELEKSGSVTIELFDLQGRIVKKILNGWREAGEYQIAASVDDLAQGVYTIRIQTPEQLIKKQLIITK